MRRRFLGNGIFRSFVPQVFRASENDVASPRPLVSVL
jgi:hypothetical protein